MFVGPVSCLLMEKTCFKIQILFKVRKLLTNENVDSHLTEKRVTCEI